jgi:hypothetical protein
MMKMKEMFLFLVLFVLLATSSFANDYGVYVKIVEAAPGSYIEVSSKIETALKSSGWDILAAYDTGVPDDCPYNSR